MNKQLIISLVVVLGVIGGGAYTLMDSDKNFSEYVPDFVTVLAGDYLPDNFKSEQQIAVEEIKSSDMVERAAQVIEGSSVVEQEESQQVSLQVEEVQEIAPEEDKAQEVSLEEEQALEVVPEVEQAQKIVEENPQQQEIEQAVDRQVADKATEETAKQDTLEQGENVVEIAMMEIQESLDEDQVQVEATSSNPKVKVIEKKIVAASTKISKLEIENKELEEKFQNILRKNRELAKKLQEIDEQLVKSK